MESDSSRGNYAPVIHPQSKSKWLSAGQSIVKLVPVIAFVLVGTSLALIQHLFYLHLNEKRIDSSATELPSFLMSQNNVNFVGTAIAHGARIMFGMAIGSAFTQVFWETLRSKSYTIAQIDALVSCGQSPFHFSAFRAARASLALYAISVTASATALVVVLTPGSLTISTDFKRERPCSVPTVPLGSNNSNETYSETTKSALISILSSDTYLHPFQNELSSTCGDGFTSCSYNVSFVGPASDCVDVTDQTNFTTFLAPIVGGEFLLTANLTNIWNASWIDDGSAGITILSWDMARNLLQATDCRSYNATYGVTINLADNVPGTIEVWNVDRDFLPLQLTDLSFTSDYAQLGFLLLSGSCVVTPNDTVFCNGPSLGSLLATTPSGNFTFSDSVSHIITSFIQNTSISLLSGNVYYGFSNTTATNLQYVDSICSSTVNVFVYSPTRLLSVYGVTLGVTIILIIRGCHLILRNGLERILLLSDLLKLALNSEMLRIDLQTKAYRRSKIQVSRTEGAQQNFIVVRSETVSDDSKLEGPLKSPEPQSKDLNAIPPARKKLALITTTHWKMALFIFGMACSMVLNHLYNSFLDMKGTNSTLRLSDRSGWLANQTIVSGINTALAYSGQTFLALAIATSCNQILWHSLRRRRHSIFGIDSIMNLQANIFSSSILSALRASVSVPLLIFLAASAPFVLIFAPGSIKINPDFKVDQNCTVLAPRNLSTLVTDPTINREIEGVTATNPLENVLASGTYFQPINGCGSGPSASSASQCTYDLQFMGPGLDCEEGLTSNNYSSFVFNPENQMTFLYMANIAAQNADDLSMQLSVQTWDTTRSLYQAASCTGVIRSYSVTISKATINVTNTSVASIIYANMSQLGTFTETYVHDMMTTLSLSQSFIYGNVTIVPTLPFTGGIGTLQLDGNVTWSDNLARTLEDFSQNATLSILSGRVWSYSSDVPDLLENVTTKCTYTDPLCYLGVFRHPQERRRGVDELL
ncbi:hypothetical protein SCHPADRAFT_651900 [Schizopora paradoxa]|uniref:Uncharacterized protein n=1 Tax=Schizopora paradoxa TaxID=27342 RepID=A0A0H2RR98_9AGAM|nr:hypothetical protein SCHPADRAFT_651900 [Schizopora paradoxa]